MRVQLEDIFPIKTVHGAGEKYVFLNKNNTLTKLTQVAIGIMTKNDIIELHEHSSMEEYYYFLEGEASFFIDDNIFNCIPNTFVKVDCKVKHKLTTNNYTKFLYWGISI